MPRNAVYDDLTKSKLGVARGEVGGLLCRGTTCVIHCSSRRAQDLQHPICGHSLYFLFIECHIVQQCLPRVHLRPRLLNIKSDGISLDPTFINQSIESNPSHLRLCTADSTQRSPSPSVVLKEFWHCSWRGKGPITSRTTKYYSMTPESTCTSAISYENWASPSASPHDIIQQMWPLSHYIAFFQP